MADACLAAIGVETSAAAVAGLYADLLDGWLVDVSDADSVDAVEALGVAARSVPLLMSDEKATRALAADTLALGETVRR